MNNVVNEQAKYICTLEICKKELDYLLGRQKNRKKFINKSWKIFIIHSHDVTVSVLIRDTYATLRNAIKVKKDRDLNRIFTDWPFLNEPSKLIDHATCLLEKSVSEVWQNSLTISRKKNYFKEMCISKNSTKDNQAQQKKNK